MWYVEVNFPHKANHLDVIRYFVAKTSKRPPHTHTPHLARRSFYRASRSLPRVLGSVAQLNPTKALWGKGDSLNLRDH